MDGSTRRPAVDRVPNSDFVPPGRTYARARDIDAPRWILAIATGGCVRRRTEIQERSGSPAGTYAAAVGGTMRPSRFASSLLYYYPFRNQE